MLPSQSHHHQLGECRRVVLFNFVRRDVVQKDGKNGKEGKDDADGDADMEDEEVEVRHYAIRTSPSASTGGCGASSSRRCRTWAG